MVGDPLEQCNCKLTTGVDGQREVVTDIDGHQEEIVGAPPEQCNRETVCPRMTGKAPRDAMDLMSFDTSAVTAVGFHGGGDRAPQELKGLQACTAGSTRRRLGWGITPGKDGRETGGGRTRQQEEEEEAEPR